MKRVYLLLCICLGSMNAIYSDEQGDLAQLEVELLSLSTYLKKLPPPPEIGTVEVVITDDPMDPATTFKYIVYTLSNGKKIRVDIARIDEINGFNLKEKRFNKLNVDAIVTFADKKCVLPGIRDVVDTLVHKKIDEDLLYFRNQLIKTKPALATYSFSDICENLEEIVPGERCGVCQAKVVPGVSLAKFILRTVLPEGKQPDSEDLLRKCYQNCLTAASQSQDALNNVFDLESTFLVPSNRGIYQEYGIEIPRDLSISSLLFPTSDNPPAGWAYSDEYAMIIVNAVYDFLMNENTPLNEVRFTALTPYPHEDDLVHAYNLWAKAWNTKLGYSKDLGL